MTKNMNWQGDGKIWDMIQKMYSDHMDEIIDAGRENPNQMINPYMLNWSEYFTPIERVFWDALRCDGVSLYPQFPAAGVFIDFANPSLKVGIEVDGKKFHDRDKDKHRDKRLARRGWKIYRLSGSDVMRQMETEDDLCELNDEPDEGRIYDWMMKTADGFVRAFRYYYINDRPDIYNWLPVRVLDRRRLADFHIPWTQYL